MTTLDLVGADRLRRDLAAGADALGDLSATNAIVAQQILSAAVPRVPIRTGRLVRSLVATATASTATVASTVPYAHPVHGGVPATHMRPTLFLTGALDAVTDQVTDTYLGAVNDVLDKIGAGS